MFKGRSTVLAVASMAAMTWPGSALAQRAAENAVASAEDAFGTNVGLESTGIYSENDTRGFSPTKAGNVRVDGIYMDTVQVLAGRLRQSTTIRVGFSAAEYPFQAPTGIVDHKFRPFPDEFGASVAFHRANYAGWIFETDFRVPIVTGHLALTGGVALSDSRQVDGSGNHGNGATIRPIIRVAGAEIAPFITRGGFEESFSRPLTVVASGPLPTLPRRGRYLGQYWTKGKSDNNNAGVTVKAALTNHLSLRGGVFRADGDRARNFTEIFTIVPAGCGAEACANHRLIADPAQTVQSDSGEVQLAWRLGEGAWQHRFIAGYRARDRRTETGGSEIRDFGSVIYGQRDARPLQSFAFRKVNAGRVEQSAFMLGYIGRREGLGSVNIGVQKARYRGTFRDRRTGLVTTSRDDPWLYNATLLIHLSPAISLYAATQKGLEDSGAAPENAINRNEQLPPTRTRQYEGGVRWRFSGGQLVVNAFEITKPYFSFDAGVVFTQLGSVRHRGIETSLSGHFGERLSLVAGALLMRPRLSGGGRPIGTPEIYTRVDVNYRTDILGDLTPTATFAYTGNRPVRPDLSVPGYAALDLGFRQHWHLGRVPGSIRAVVQNVFDAKRWKVVAANTVYPDDRRRFTVSIAADF